MGFIPDVRWRSFPQQGFKTVLWKVIEDRIPKNRVCHIWNGNKEREVTVGKGVKIFKTSEKAMKWAKAFIRTKPNTDNWVTVNQ